MPTKLEFELSSISKQVQTDHLLHQEANQIFQHLPYQAAHFFSSTNIFSGLLKNLYLKLENLRIIRWVLFQYMKMQKSRVHFFHSNEMILDGIHRRKFGDWSLERKVDQVAAKQMSTKFLDGKLSYNCCMLKMSSILSNTKYLSLLQTFSNKNLFHSKLIQPWAFTYLEQIKHQHWKDWNVYFRMFIPIPAPHAGLTRQMSSTLIMK